MNLKHRLRRRLINIGISRAHATQWSACCQKQIDAMGPEAAITFLKKVGDCIIWALTESGAKPDWVKTRFRYPVIFLGIHKYPEAIQLRVAKLARAIVLKDVTSAQVAKVVTAVRNPYNGSPEGIHNAWHYILLGASLLKGFPSASTDGSYPLVTRQFRRVQSVSGKTGLIQEPPVLESLKICADMPFLQDLPGWESVFHPLHPEWVRENISRFQSSWPLKHVGEIHASQEGGGKLRMFASPYTVIQCLLSPIHDYMDFYRRQLATDCTYDQTAGAVWAQSLLKQERIVHSVDLSTATCRFPWELQERLCQHLELSEESIHALRLVAKGKWKVSKKLRRSFNCSSLSWAVGQPLGIRPSMSLFSLTHNLLLSGISISLGLEPTETFRILGDDVIISNDDAHQLYLDVIAEIGVPISWHKSHSSNTFAEFAGFSITRTSLVRPGQWRPVEYANALSLALELRTPTYGEVPKSVERAQELWLFRHGLWDPDPADWSRLLRSNSVLNDTVIKWMKSNADFWYYAIMHKIQSQFSEFLNSREPIPFVSDSPSCSALRLSSDDVSADVLDSLNSKLPGLSYMNSHPTFCYAGIRAEIELFRDLGRITPDQSLELILQLQRKANTLLYQPPSDYVIGGSPTLKSVLSALGMEGAT